MASEMTTYYLIRRGGSKVAIELVHCVSNKCAAKKAMLAAFGIRESDIELESGGNPIWARTNACMTFDGRNAH
ncbi:MAG: hypothetical protein IKC87_05210 [Clostridia bacterium]|nr:hypothetical protein [Clostridia bacterium]